MRNERNRILIPHITYVLDDSKYSYKIFISADSWFTAGLNVSCINQTFEKLWPVL